MIKQHKWRLLVTSLIILLPMVVGLILWDTLPQRIATHWGVDGKPDGFSSRGFAVFGIPLFVLAMHWICVVASAFDKKNRDKNQKMQRIVLWICPVVSLFAGAAIYAWVTEMPFRIDMIGLLLIGSGFIVIGNYLPKCQQNTTIGIKVKWTLENEENWNATHRFSSRVWMIGGVLFIAAVLLPEAVVPYLLFALLPVLALVPFLYSYLYHRKQMRK